MVPSATRSAKVESLSFANSPKVSQCAGKCDANVAFVMHGCAASAIKRWRKWGLVVGRVVNDKDEYLYQDPGDDPRVRKAAALAARVRPVAPGSRGFRIGGAV